MDITKEQVESLAKFVLEVLDDWPELSTLDGCDIQDIAEKHNILIPTIRHEPCGEYCNCMEFCNDNDWQRGVTCYRIADWLTRDAQQADEASSSPSGLDSDKKDES